MGVCLDRLALSIQRPERVPKEVVRVIKFLDLAEPVPVSPERGHGAFGRLVAPEETWEGPSLMHWLQRSRDPFFCRVDTPIIVDVHFPLVESGDCERGLSLGFWNTGVLVVRNRTASKLEQPRASEWGVCELQNSFIDDVVRQGTDQGRADEPLPASLSAQNLSYTILLMEEALFVDLIE